MKREPIHYLWWLISRASGIVALVLIAVSVSMGLAMAAKLVAPPRKRTIAQLHEQVALLALGAVAVHGLSLLGDPWLAPGLKGITVPLAMSYRPLYTGAGIVAAYLLVMMGPTFYVRRRIGTRTWRRLHRGIAVVWLLAAVHTLGAGSDAAQLWLRGIVVLPGIPVVYLVVLRMLGAQRRPRTHAQSVQSRSEVASFPGRQAAPRGLPSDDARASSPRANRAAARALAGESGVGR